MHVKGTSDSINIQVPKGCESLRLNNPKVWKIEVSSENSKKLNLLFMTDAPPNFTIIQAKFNEIFQSMAISDEN